MEFDKQIKLGHLLLNDRKCRICGETKNIKMPRHAKSWGNGNKILEQFNKSHPENIKVLNELANLYWFDGNKKKALEYKFIVFKYY